MSESSRRGLQTIVSQAAGDSTERLKGKVAIITGSNSLLGIGQAAVQQFAQNGARAVYMCDNDATHLGARQKENKSIYPAVDIHVGQFDPTDGKAVKEVVDDAIRRYGRLDVFFATAGLPGPNVTFGKINSEEFVRSMSMNILGPFRAAKHAAPAMRKTCTIKPEAGGSIIMMASIAGLRSNAGATAYSASNAAVISMAQTLAFQLAGTICPGVIEMNMTSLMPEGAGIERKIDQFVPLRRGRHADEIARVALFLGTDYRRGQLC